LEIAAEALHSRFEISEAASAEIAAEAYSRFEIFGSYELWIAAGIHMIGLSLRKRYAV
jgi:hypothetical protein